MSSAEMFRRLSIISSDFLEVSNNIATFLTSYVFDVTAIGNELGLDLSWIPQDWFTVTWGGALFGMGIFTIITLTIIRWAVGFSPL